MFTPLVQKFLLGVVQGLTEFLPVSSSAHLILIPRLFNWEDPGLAFDVALHLGTLLGVLLYFWRDLWALVVPWLRFSDPTAEKNRKLGIWVVVGTIPAVISGLLLEHKAETLFRSPVLIAWTFIVAGAALAAADLWLKGSKTTNDLSFKDAVIIGLAQSLAIIPGVSRSGSTITAGLAIGMNRQEAARFSFLLSVPVIAGAGVLKLKEILHSSDHLGLLVGFTGAAISGFIAIYGLMRYIQTHRYLPFVYYRWAVALAILFFWQH